VKLLVSPRATLLALLFC